MSIKQTDQRLLNRSTNALPLLRESPEISACPVVEEKTFPLFQPDILLAAQYYATTKRRNYLEPERKLMLSVLEDAILCFQNYLLSTNARGRLLFREAEQWIMETDGDWLFSFDNICNVLGLDSGYIRNGLMRWRERELAATVKPQVHRLIYIGEKKRRPAGAPGASCMNS